MAWNFGSTEVAEVESVSLDKGEPMEGAFQIRVAVTFATYGAPEGVNWKIWPNEVNVWLAKSWPDRRFWACFRGAGAYLGPSSNLQGKPLKMTLHFTHEFSAAELAALEEWRDGSDLKMKVLVRGFGTLNAETKPEQKTTQTKQDQFRELDTEIPRSRWVDLLAELKFREAVHVHVPIDLEARIVASAEKLREALDHHARGDYQGVAQTCRKALEALGQAGFGRRAPRDIENWLGTRQEREMLSLEDRTAVIEMAARLLCHSGSHAGEEELRWRRFDADLLLAITAGLLHSAPHRLQRVEPVPATPASGAPPETAPPGGPGGS
jgi:hypothetical protein